MNQKINISFNIFSGSPLRLIVEDISDWYYAEDKPSYIQITLPGSKKPKNFSFAKNKRNMFNSNNLGISCFSDNCKEQEYIDLPDGIYIIEVKSNFEGISAKKYFLKTDKLDVEYNKVLAKYGIDNLDNGFIDYMLRIKYILFVAEANLEDGDFVKADTYYKEAKKLLDRYVECENCL